MQFYCSEQLWLGHGHNSPETQKSNINWCFRLVKDRSMGFQLQLKVEPAANLRLFLLFPGCKIAPESNPRIKLSRRLPFFTKLPLRLPPSTLQKLSLLLFSFSPFAKLLLLAFSTMEAMLFNPFSVFMAVAKRSLKVFCQNWLVANLRLDSISDQAEKLQSSRARKLHCWHKFGLMQPA